MLRNAKMRKILFVAVSAAILSACGGGGGSSPSTEMVNNAIGARGVIDRIEALPEAESVTVSDVAAVNQAIAAYNNLGSAQQSLVSKASLDKLKALAAAIDTAAAAAEAVHTEIAALPSVISKADAAKVTAAREKFNALSDAQETWVAAEAVESLGNAEAVVNENQAKASRLAAEIGALPSEISKTDSAKVTAARNNFDALSDAQETWVAAEAVAGLGKAEAVVAQNQAKAEEVAEKIKVLPENGLDVDTDEKIKAFTEAKKAFDDLTDAEETWVEAESAEKLKQVAEKTVIDADETSLAKINEPAPLPTSFLTLEVNGKAQQFNPNIQLRTDGRILNNQTALIHEIAVSDGNAQASVQDKIGVVGISFREDNKDVGNSDNKIELIGKVKSQDIVTQNDRADIQNILDSANEIVYRQDTAKTVFDKKWDGVYAVKTTNGAVIVMRDPAAIGWNYQTFAYYNNPANNITHAYQSIGIETPANAMPTAGTATYNGLTTAQYVVNGQTKQMTADVKAVADFGKKLVRFETANAHLHTLENGARKSNPEDGLNIKGKASWSAGNQFAGTVATKNMTGTLNGKFYGANAAEIGGTYGLKNAANTEQLIGGYGAKRQ